VLPGDAGFAGFCFTDAGDGITAFDAREERGFKNKMPVSAH
jgi:hypothetical protein